MGNNLLAVLGAASLDIIIKVERFLSEDEIILPVEGPFRLPGGSAANIAVGASRLGIRSFF